jgi:hypothetical protein
VISTNQNSLRRPLVPLQPGWPDPRFVKTRGRPIKHARYCWRLLPESHLTRWLFAGMLSRVAACRRWRDSLRAVAASKSGECGKRMGRCLLIVSRGWIGSGFWACEVTHLPISSADLSLRNHKHSNICIAARIYALYGMDGQGENGNSGSIIECTIWRISGR